MRLTIPQLLLKKNQTPIVMITAYDAWMAKLVDHTVDCILVGDSAGMMVQGYNTTLPITLDEIIYHTQLVVRGSEQALVITDLPFLSYQSSVEKAIESAGRCLKEGGAQAVKLEGGQVIIPQIKALVSYGIPVFGHLGLLPQSINALGSFQKQAKTAMAAQHLLEEAQMLEQAGVSGIILECIPDDLAQKVTEQLKIPTIGIGAGPFCDGQVQVFHDLFGFYSAQPPKHTMEYYKAYPHLQAALENYANDVRTKNIFKK